MSLNHIVKQSSLNPKLDVQFKDCYADNFYDSEFVNLIPDTNTSDARTTNTTIIQNSLDQGGTKQIPRGTYYINTITATSDNTWLRGSGMYECILVFGTSVALLNVSGVNNFKVSDLTLNGFAPSGESTIIRLSNSDYSVVENVFLTMATADGIEAKESNYLRITDCVISYTNGRAMDMSDLDNTIISNNIIYAGAVGIYAAQCDNLLLDGNVINICNSYGIQASSSNSVNAINNMITRTGNNNIAFDGVLNSTIISNNLKYCNQLNNASAMILLNECVGCEISSNVIYENDLTSGGGFTGPNGVVYLGKLYNCDIAVSVVSATPTYNQIFDNIISSVIATSLNDVQGGSTARLISPTNSLTNVSSYILNRSANSNSQTVMSLDSIGNNSVEIRGSGSAAIKLFSPVGDTVDLQLYTIGTTYGMTVKGDLNVYDNTFTNNLLRIPSTGGILIPAQATPQYTGYAPTAMSSYVEGSYAAVFSAAITGATATIKYRRIGDKIDIFIPGFSGTLDALATQFEITGLPSTMQSTGAVGSIFFSYSTGVNLISGCEMAGSSSQIIIYPAYPSITALGAVVYEVNAFTLSFSR